VQGNLKFKKFLKKFINGKKLKKFRSCKKEINNEKKNKKFKEI